ncbi:hypothetical protein [Puniceicoccus vermicola]|uniref:Uncharacterized protein n=1 Tax=Puniceicoccus vermicola TaxID=388746 RepID=A0A7X1B1R2_9BACT|nr:hypothetical protein [Puniceicoccus vermicola]MBC2604021.1 hypothetical protein [Puniceicoccus vermicola]
MKTPKPNLLFLLPAILTLLLSGCATISPSTYRGTANGYNVAMQKVGEEQLLLNIVRLRYRDAPYFFEASSITSQLDLNSSLGVAGTFPLSGSAPDALSGNTGISFAERPTISYTPLQGDDFFNRLLGRITFEDISLLTNSGWSMDTVSRMVIQRTNGMNNAMGASGPTPEILPQFKEFREVADTLFQLQRHNAIQMGEVQSENGYEPVIFLPAPGSNEDADRLRELLSLDPELDVYRVRPGAAAVPSSNGDLIEINTRSLLGVLFFLSQGVNVPEKDVESGKVTKTLYDDGTVFDWNEPLDGLFRVESSNSEPDNASTAVRYRGTWFYIKDDDLLSKATFMLLSQMFALRTGDAQGQTPVLTIPVAN